MTATARRELLGRRGAALCGLERRGLQWPSAIFTRIIHGSECACAGCWAQGFVLVVSASGMRQLLLSCCLRCAVVAQEVATFLIGANEYETHGASRCCRLRDGGVCSFTVRDELMRCTTALPQGRHPGSLGGSWSSGVGPRAAMFWGEITVTRCGPPRAHVC